MNTNKTTKNAVQSIRARKALTTKAAGRLDVRRFHALATELRAMLYQAVSLDEQHGEDDAPSIQREVDGQAVADYGPGNTPSPKDAYDAADELQYFSEVLLSSAMTARVEEALEQAA